MTLQQIRYVIGVQQAGSFNQASKKLYISQPSLTSAVHELEYELGFPIFNRNPRGITVTKRGNEFLEDAKKLYSQYQILLENYTEKEKKTFSVSTLYYAFARRAFVEIVHKFGNEEFDFSFREMKAEEVINDVAERKSDIGILYLSDANRVELLKKFESKNLEFNHLTECNAFVYLHKNHPLAEQESISLDELAEYQFVTYDKDDLTAFFSPELLKRRELRQAITAVDRSTVLNLLKALNGYTFLTGILGEEAEGDYILLPLRSQEKDDLRTFELGYITLKGARRDNIFLTFIDYVRRILHIAGFSC